MGQDTSWVDDPQARADALRRVIAIVNEKGGVGKTTITSNLAGQAAASGYRVLVVDINRQANLALDLGYRRAEGIDDEGEALLTAIMRSKAVTPVGGVRPNLDVVPGGELLADLARAAARWVLIPTKSDDGGLDGMRLVAKRFRKAREINPQIGLLGVVLFATGTGATAIHAEVRKSISATFGGNSPLFQTIIRHSERIARDSRKGKLAHELEEAAKDQPQWWKMLRDGEKVS